MCKKEQELCLISSEQLSDKIPVSGKYLAARKEYNNDLSNLGKNVSSLLEDVNDDVDILQQQCFGEVSSLLESASACSPVMRSNTR
ncbi:hypothetical protein [Ehrlichia canis]|uniref:Uncharacterized protein n=1 Tax=Ehrlichia canis (strain Jake) TaxID=269484 RepID=A0ACA6AVR7_EHRCJ|nr:hypothetical protein [Ehrlichia canis]AAZ68399.1 hypothetical protein Ecaj_0356 [Ehrlichia canis str. Jake]